MYKLCINKYCKYNHSYGSYTYNSYELNHVIRKYLDGGATEADSRASAPVYSYATAGL